MIKDLLYIAFLAAIVVGSYYFIKDTDHNNTQSSVKDINNSNTQSSIEDTVKKDEIEYTITKTSTFYNYSRNAMSNRKLHIKLNQRINESELETLSKKINSETDESGQYSNTKFCYSLQGDRESLNEYCWAVADIEENVYKGNLAGFTKETLELHKNKNPVSNEVTLIGEWLGERGYGHKVAIFKVGKKYYLDFFVKPNAIIGKDWKQQKKLNRSISSILDNQNDPNIDYYDELVKIKDPKREKDIAFYKKSDKNYKLYITSDGHLDYYNEGRHFWTSIYTFANQPVL